MVNALGQKSVNYGPQAKHGPPFVFVNKVLLEYSYAHLSGESNGNPLQYSFLENSIDRGDWPTTVHGFAKSQTRLSD